MKHEEKVNNSVKKASFPFVAWRNRGVGKKSTIDHMVSTKVSHTVRTQVIVEKMDPEELVAKVKNLIAWYQRSRSTQLAMYITQYIELLVNHRNADSLDEHVLCEYRRLSRHWEYLGSQKPQYMSIFK